MRRSNESVKPAQPSATWSRVGLVGFALFFGKGILWLLAPVLFALMRQ
jgi:hypothetical protein